MSKNTFLCGVYAYKMAQYTFRPAKVQKYLQITKFTMYKLHFFCYFPYFFTNL